MKIIDDKGRFLGIVNFLDMTILLIVILLAGSIFYLNFNKTGLKSIQPSTGEQEIFTTFFISGLRDVSINSINEGDFFENAESGNTLGEVVSKTVSNTQLATTNKDGEVVYADIPDRYDIMITLKGKGTVSEDSIKLSNEQIRIGRSVILQNRIIRTNSIIFGIEY